MSIYYGICADQMGQKASLFLGDLLYIFQEGKIVNAKIRKVL